MSGEVVECLLRLQIEEKLRVLLFVILVHDVFRVDVLGQGIGTLDHRGDDVLDSDLLGLHQISNGLAAPDLEPKFKAGLPGNLHQSEELIGPGTFGLELSLDGDISEFVSTSLQDIQHLPLQMVHSHFLYG